MDIRQIKNGDVATLILGGRFDFNVHRDFKEIYSSALADDAIQKIEVNLAEVDYLDSSALGMLLMLRERAQNVNKTVALLSPNETVVKILDIANFHKLFTIGR
ncbi:MAG: STAS domain-containing protein [Gallionellaceae bacterium]|jgi:anti-anti-sigma factor